MRLVVGLVGAVVSSGLVAVSMFMNFRFGQLQGSTEFDAFIYSLAFLFGDGLKVILPFALAWAWSERRYLAVIACLVGFAITIPLSVSSSLGFAATNRTVIAGERVSLSSEVADLEAALARKSAAYSTMDSARAEAVIAGDLAAAKGHDRWRSTQGCTNATVALSLQFCAEYAALQAELEAARNRQSLDAEIDALRADLSAARSRAQDAGAVAGEPDPQVSVIQKLLQTDETQARTILTVLLSAFVEFGSSFGFYLSLGHLKPGERLLPRLRREDDPAVPPRPVSGSEAEIALQWGQDRLIGDPSGAVAAGAMYEDYVAWCEARSVRPMSLTAFGRWLGTQGLEKTRRAGRIYYQAVRLRQVVTPLAATF